MASVALIASREVNEVRQPHTYLQQAVCVRRKKTKKNHEIPPHPKHTRLKNIFLVLETPYGPASCYEQQRPYVRHAECAIHRAAAHLPAGIEGVIIHASTSLLRMSTGVLCLASNDHWCCTVCALGA